jgi:hypothetical protein
MLRGLILNVIMTSLFMLNVVLQNVILPGLVVQSGFRLNVVVLNVVAPFLKQMLNLFFFFEIPLLFDWLHFILCSVSHLTFVEKRGKFA